LGIPAEAIKVTGFSNQLMPYGMNNNLSAPVQIPVKIYLFYTTDDKNTHYKDSLDKSFFPIEVTDNPYPEIVSDVGNKYSVAQVMKFYQKFIETINAIKFGIRLNYLGYEITDQWLLETVGNTSVIQISKSTPDRAIHRDMRKKSIPFFSLNMAQTNNVFKVNGVEDVFLHEFRHCLGFSHNNVQIGDVGFNFGKSTGFYRYIPYGGAPAGKDYNYFSPLYYTLRRGLDEDNTSIIWSFYGKESSQTFPIITIQGTIKDNDTNRKYFLDGQAMAFIWDRQRKELFAQSIVIAKTGAFKFEYPIGFNKNIKIGLLITSCEFHSAYVSYKLINKYEAVDKPAQRKLSLQSDGYYKSTYTVNDAIFKKDWPGRIYYYSKHLDSITQTLVIDPGSNLKIAKNVKQIEKDVGCHILYSGGSTVIGSDNFEYECISDHLSDITTKPVTGDKYYTKWQQVSDIVGDYSNETKKWVNGKTYNSKFTTEYVTKLKQSASLENDVIGVK